ncbi:hypothetical protein Acr_12g0002710 [Actinidia rufa]|uniref:Uncharacterized protein n=1 Tax=Actinidia rufa TaxID=165716 RepID=A0A7J0FGA4_9ERIC|nr:hypothetical protein Acr_12g0002710 [Actinidia rufa]
MAGVRPLKTPPSCESDQDDDKQGDLCGETSIWRVSRNHRDCDGYGFLMEARSSKINSDLDKSETTARLEAKVAELTSKLALAKKLAIEEFKSSNNFKEVFTDSTVTYFGKGFEFYKRQLFHQYPNLDVDVASMEMDADLAKEEEAARAGEKEEDSEGKASLTP